MRTVVALVALALLVAGCSDEPESEAASPPSKRSATPAPCPASGAVLRKGQPDGASGIKVLGLDLHNCGRAAIRLKGYPSLTLYDAQGAPVKVKVGHGSKGVASVESFDGNPTDVTLAPGETASAAVLWRNHAKDGAKPSVTAASVEVAPKPGMPAQRLANAGIDLGATTKVGVSAWMKSRDATGSQPGDGAPHHGDNTAWKRRAPLSPSDRIAGGLVAGKARPVLERLRARKDVAPPAVRAALLHAGFRADRTFTQPYRASAASDVPPPGSVFEIRAGERACVFGSVDPGRVTVRVDGPTREGTCLEPFAH